MNVLNAAELHTEKWLKWYILCYISFYTNKSKAMYILIQGNKTNIPRTLNSHARECVMKCQRNGTTMRPGQSPWTQLPHRDWLTIRVHGFKSKNYTLGRTGHVNHRAQRKTVKNFKKTTILQLKNRFQEDDNRAFNQAQGPSGTFLLV